MKKFFAVMAVIILSLTTVVPSFAVNATEARNPEAEPMIMYGTAPQGAIAKVSAAPIKRRFTGSGIVSLIPIKLYTITLYSDTTGDVIGLYDEGATSYGPTNAQALEFEIAIAANTSSTSVNFNGAKFENGLRITASDATNSIVGVVYDY